MFTNSYIFRNVAASLMLIYANIGCSLSDLVKVEDPETQSTLDRDFVRSPQGAKGLFYNSLGLLQLAVNDRNLDISLFTDELTVRPFGSTDHENSLSLYSDPRNPRVLIGENFRIEGVLSPAYLRLQSSRISAMQARAFLKNLKNPSFNTEIAASYAVEGYTILMLAEDMCSGIPLSEVPSEGEIIYGRGLRTDELFKVAVAKFDSSLQIEHDSIKYITLAKIGKGRALMGLGEYSKAAEAVASVTQSDKYEFKYNEIAIPTSGGTTSQLFRYWTWAPLSPTFGSTTRSTEIINNEGVNGLVWFANPRQLDPRLPVTTQIINDTIAFPPVVRQRKFIGGTLAFPLARWVEAKMIEAESYLNTDDSRWIEIINEARRSVGIADTVEPTAWNEKVNLLFRERAYWFYGEGVRLADFRRLVRQYGRNPYNIYPSGAYGRQQLQNVYGIAYVYIPAPSDLVDNPKYDGCFNDNP